jgi:tetratricopeptide (TPR) repeat protein
MNLQTKTRRRAAVLALVAIITVACGSILRTALDRDLLPAHVVLRTFAAVSIFPSDRAYYRLQAVDREFRAEAATLLTNPAPGERDALVEHVRRRAAALTEQHETFVNTHPRHVRGRVAIARFLFDTGKPRQGLVHLERAAELAGDDDELWVQLGQKCIAVGDIRKAFGCFERALESNPENLACYRDYANSILVYRRDAMLHYDIDEEEVFTRGLGLLWQALEHYPKNMDLAMDLGRTYYAVKPGREDEAIAAWQHVGQITKDDFRRQEVRVHLARFLIRAGRLEEAREQLAGVNMPEHEMHKGRVLATLERSATAGPEVVAVPASFVTE